MFQNIDRKLAIKIGVVVLTIGLVVAVVLYIGVSPSEGGSDSSSSTSAAVFIPIYTAAFIPLLAKKKKGENGEEEEISQNKKILLGLLVGVTLLMIVGTIVFMLVN